MVMVCLQGGSGVKRVLGWYEYDDNLFTSSGL